MKTIPLFRLATPEGISGITGIDTSFFIDTFAAEYEFLLNHANSLVHDGTHSVFVGSYSVLLRDTNMYYGMRVSSSDPQWAFIINESMRLRAEYEEFSKLFDIACDTARGHRPITANTLLGLVDGSEKPGDFQAKHMLIIRNFQRANHSTLLKMKEANVRALIRGVKPAFDFVQDFDLGEDTSRMSKETLAKHKAKGTYKSIFD